MQDFVSASELQRRIRLLESLREALSRWSQGDTSKANSAFINSCVLAAQRAVKEAGAMQVVILTPPPLIGGPVLTGVNPFDMIFQDYFGD